MNIVDSITEIINSLTEISGIGICFYDLKKFFNYQQYGLKKNGGHYCEFCTCARLLNNGRQHCNKSDRADAVILAGVYRKPFFFQCHMGMRELVLPIFHKETLLGLLFVGQCRLENESTESEILERVATLGGDGNTFLKKYRELPIMTRQKLLSVGKILQHYFDTAIFQIDALPPHAVPPGGNLAQRLHTYIEQHFMHNITPGIIAQVFFLSEAHIARVFKNAYHCTITAYIHEVRIINAQRLLSSTLIPIKSIALNVGFSDANYFSRVFRDHTGKTPSQYRQETC